LLDSALARPVNRWNYGADSAADMAAAYAYGVARNHPFIDGNKRTAWVLARLFLAINGHRLAFTAEDAIRMMLAVAAGELDEAAMVEWFKARLSSA
jgi:death-on-curing protein